MANYVFTDNENFADNLKAKMVSSGYCACTVKFSSLEAFLLFKREALPKHRDILIVVGKWASNLVSVSYRNQLKMMFFQGDTMSLVIFSNTVWSSIKHPFQYTQIYSTKYSVVKVIDKKLSKNSFLEKAIDNLSNTLHHRVCIAFSDKLSNFDFSPIETGEKDIEERLIENLKRGMEHVSSEQEKLIAGFLSREDVFRKMPVTKTAK